MVRILLFLIFTLLFSLGKAQIVFNTTLHDFGLINTKSPHFIDIKLTNTSSKDAFILSIKKPKGVIYIKQSAFIKPGASSFIRFSIGRYTKGKFNYKIPVFTSDKKEPTTIILKGEVEKHNQSSNNVSFTACPTFGQIPPVQAQTSFTLTVKTVDKTTGQPLEKAKLIIANPRYKSLREKTNKEGVFTAKIPLGIYHFTATYPGYYPTTLNQYVNFKRNFVLLELLPKEKQEAISTRPNFEKDSTIQIAENTIKNQPERTITISTVPEIKKDTSAKMEEIQPLPPKFANIDTSNFSPEYFQPINVVFVIDISGSMRNFNRIDILKTALEELAQMIRPEDRIGVVSYASDAEVLIKSTSGKRKEKIIKKIKAIRPSGRTAGGAGIKLGYKEARKNKLKNGKNHLIIITDGAFNLGSDNYKTYIKENLQKDITMSVVGVKCNPSAAESMRETAKLGHGRLILIDRRNDIQKLKREIRLASFRFTNR